MFRFLQKKLTLLSFYSWYSASSRDSSVSIATRYGLEGRISVRVRFSAAIQTDPGAHLSSFTMGTGSFPEVQQLELGVDHPPTSSVEVKERVELYLHSSSGPS
jgi:hypothetical protein